MLPVTAFHHNICPRWTTGRPDRSYFLDWAANYNQPVPLMTSAGSDHADVVRQRPVLVLKVVSEPPRWVFNNEAVRQVLRLPVQHLHRRLHTSP